MITNGTSSLVQTTGKVRLLLVMNCVMIVIGMNSMYAPNGPDVVLFEKNIILKQKNKKNHK